MLRNCNKQRTQWSRTAFLLAAGCLGIAGCGQQKMADVAGRVVYAKDGEAATNLTGYRVSFLSSHDETDGKKKRITATGKVEKDGTFTMSTYEMNDGVLLGTHQIALTPPPVFGFEKPKKPILDPRFGNLKRSGLSAVVDGDTEVVLEVQRAQ